MIPLEIYPVTNGFVIRAAPDYSQDRGRCNSAETMAVAKTPEELAEWLAKFYENRTYTIWKAA